MTTTHTVPTGTMATAFDIAIARAIAPTSNYAYFDIVDFLDDSIQNPALKERVMSYMSWKIDMTCINRAKKLFWDSYKDSQIDTTQIFDEFIVGFQGVVDQSITFGSGSELTLVKLLSLRSIWHSYAASAAAYMNRDYRQRELVELITIDHARTPSLDTSKIAIECEEAAQGDKALEAELLHAGIARATQLANDRKATDLKIRPCVLATIDAALACHCDEVNFWELDDELQSEMIHAGIAAIKSAKTQLSTNAKIATSEFREIILDARNTTDELIAVIEKKFSDTVVAQSSIDTMRMAEHKARRAALLN